MASADLGEDGAFRRFFLSFNRLLTDPLIASSQVRRNAEGQGEGWASPREDINAPDLYIPSA